MSSSKVLGKGLNIANIGHKRIPSREGGIEIVVEELAKRVVKLGHRVTAYNRAGHHVSGSEFDKAPGNGYKEYAGIRIVTVPALEVKGLAAMTSSFFATLVSLFGGYDCIHYHAEGPSAMLWLPHLFGIRTVATIHGLDWQRAKWGGLAARYIKSGEKTAAKYADEIIVLSENVRNYFKETYGRDTVFIPNGVERPEKKPAGAIKERWGLEQDGYILFLGRLVPEKGLGYLIEAFRDLGTDKKMVIAGGASDTGAFISTLRESAGADPRVIFTGFVQGRELEELYSNAYVYVLPSDLEGMPLSLLEAMSYGNCCLTSDIPECASVVEDKAVVFKKGNAGDLRDKLEYLCKNPDVVRRYKDSAADYICGKYNWDDAAEKTVALYMGDKR